jgi:hypothetical protein
VTPVRQPEDDNFLERIERIEDLAAELDRAPDPVPRQARALVQAVLDIHKAGLTRIVQRLDDTGESGREFLAGLAADDLVGALLVLHDLHPVPLTERVDAVLDQLRTQGCDTDVLEIRGGLVRLRLREECCLPVGAMRSLVEQALTAAVPDVATIEFEERDSVPSDGAVTYFPLPVLGGPGYAR